MWLLLTCALSATHYHDAAAHQQRKLERLDSEHHFLERRFRQKVDKALVSVHQLLDTARNPTFAEDEPHTYGDKFALAEHLTSVAIAAQLNVLESLGLDAATLQRSRHWALEGRTVTLRLRAVERCEYLREATSDLPRGPVVRNSGIFGTSESQVVTRRQEFFWHHEVEHELLLFAGANATAGSTAMLRQRTGRVELMTTVREAPRPALHAPPEIDVEISWLLRQLSASDGATATAGASAGAAGAQAGAAGGPPATVLQVAYAIDRGHSACRTPRRNLQSEAALERARLLHAWATVR